MSEPNGSTPSQLTAEVIVDAFQALSDELAKNQITGELCLFGGAVMVLAFQARVSTKDVDAIFQPSEFIRSAAQKIAAEKQLSKDWLNDGVKGFIATQPQVINSKLPQFANLRLVMPVPEYLLAMKCMAGRLGREGSASDVPDIIFLIRHLGLKTAAAVLDVVAQYYGKSGVPVKTQYLVEGLFEEGQV